MGMPWPSVKKFLGASDTEMVFLICLTADFSYPPL
jgi:hypothetical protein